MLHQFLDWINGMIGRQPTLDIPSEVAIEGISEPTVTIHGEAVTYPDDPPLTEGNIEAVSDIPIQLEANGNATP
jgi:hypothetical protein